MKAVRPVGRDQPRLPRWDVPGLRARREDGESRGAGASLTGENGSSVVSYGTEAGQFQAAGYSAVVCGPGKHLRRPTSPTRIHDRRAIRAKASR